MASGEVSGDIERWKEILRRASAALAGRAVFLWQADARGRLHLLVSSRGPAPDGSIAELGAALRKWFGERPAGAMWVASRIRAGRWTAAPVRSAALRPPPGEERRSADRMTLELAGLCIGLLGGSAMEVAPPAGGLHAPERSRRIIARLVD
jgi:hypothetical protein